MTPRRIIFVGKPVFQKNMLAQAKFPFQHLA
jgi:hypothetical protein